MRERREAGRERGWLLLHAIAAAVVSATLLT